jgi:hypothetical protein
MKLFPDGAHLPDICTAGQGISGGVVVDITREPAAATGGAGERLSVARSPVSGASDSTGMGRVAGEPSPKGGAGRPAERTL